MNNDGGDAGEGAAEMSGTDSASDGPVGDNPTE